MVKPNYSMRFGSSEIGRLLNVSRDLIKTWAFVFQDYLQPTANPGIGMIRSFCSDDLLVFAYIAGYWEDNPDIENIKAGLNAQEQLNSPYSEILIEVTPMFRDIPDSPELEYIKGVVFSGLSDGDLFIVADSYKYSGDILVDAATNDEEQAELLFPVMFNYRHATELYLKATVGKTSENNHRLRPLLDRMKLLLKTEFDTSLPAWFENIVAVFDDFDPGGTAFRYPDNITRDEVLIDLTHVKTLIGWLSAAFHRVRRARDTKAFSQNNQFED